MSTSRDVRTPYEAQWGEYRRWTWIFWGLALGWLPFGAVVFETLDYFGAPDWPDWLPFPLLFGYMAVIAYYGTRTNNFRCPRCSKRFFLTTWSRNTFAMKCRHCGLPKWAGSERRPL